MPDIHSNPLGLKTIRMHDSIQIAWWIIFSNRPLSLSTNEFIPTTQWENFNLMMLINLEFAASVQFFETRIHQFININHVEMIFFHLTLISPTPQILCQMAQWDYSTYV